jgi:predicted nucleic acid-binding protein
MLNRPIMLDSGPLGKLAHHSATKEIFDWYIRLENAGVPLIIPEIVDYEVRRSLLLSGLNKSLIRLNELKAKLIYQPLTTQTMLKAAEFWADARRRGKPTSDPKELDADVILAAQAIEAGAIITTKNVGHLSRYATAKH